MVFGIADLREAVGERADHAELLHAALQFARGEIGVLQRQRGERLEAVRALAHLFGEIVVGLARDLVGLFRIGDGLDRRAR